MRSYIAQGLILTCLAAPVLAQETPSGASAPAPVNQAQLEMQRAQLLRFGTRLELAARKYKLFEKITNLANSDQLSAIKQLRISPSQAMDLLKLVQSNLPTGPMDKAASAAFRQAITPGAEKILGADQFDLLLQLVPSPQQTAQVQTILNQVAATPEGAAAREAASDLSKSLSDDQRRFFSPVLNLLNTPGTPAAAAPPAKKPARPAAGPKPSRMLVYLKKTSLGDTYAEVYPESNFTEYLPHRYRVEGADPSVLSALSNADGLPVRVLGTLQDDLLSLASNSFSGPPSLLAISGNATAWRGRLPAKVNSVSPPTVTLNLGRGQFAVAALDLQTDAEREGLSRHAGGDHFLLGGTALTQAGNITMCDLDFADWRPNTLSMASAASIQLSEDLLEHAANSFLTGHPEMFGGGSGNVRFAVGDIGATLLGCQPGQVRIFGNLTGTHTGLEMLGANAEVVCAASLVKGRLQLTPVPGSLQVRVDYPLFAALPPGWSSNLERMAGSQYSSGLSLPVTDPFAQQILQSGIMVQSQLDGLSLATLPAGDRRTGLVAVVAPAAAAPAVPSVELLRNRVQAPGEFTLALSEDTLNTAIKAKLPPMLPIKRPVPKEMQNQGGVTLSEVEIPELDLSFSKGVFLINTCVVNVHWSFGLFSGVEPGCRFKGSATVSGGGNPAKVSITLHIDQVEFLSTRITGLPASEQQDLKDKLMKAAADFPLDLPLPQDLMVKVLGPQTRLVVTGASGTPEPSELLVQGRLDP